MFCYHCGEKNQEIAIFCKKCGSRMVAQDSVLNANPPNESSSFLGAIFSTFSGIAAYTAQIIISAIISFAVLFGLIWAWAKYGSQN